MNYIARFLLIEKLLFHTLVYIHVDKSVIYYVVMYVSVGLDNTKE